MGRRLLGRRGVGKMRQDIARVLPPEQYPMGDISAANRDLRGMFDLEPENVSRIANVTRRSFPGAIGRIRVFPPVLVSRLCARD